MKEQYRLEDEIDHGSLNYAIPPPQHVAALFEELDVRRKILLRSCTDLGILEQIATKLKAVADKKPQAVKGVIRGSEDPEQHALLKDLPAVVAQLRSLIERARGANRGSAEEGTDEPALWAMQAAAVVADLGIRPMVVKEALQNGAGDTLRPSPAEWAAERYTEVFNILLAMHLRMIKSVTKCYRPDSSFSRGDAFQEGVFGLMRSIEAYDVKRGTKPVTLVHKSIRRAARKVFDGANIVRRPQSRDRVRIEETFGRMWHELERKPSPAEVAQRLGMTEPAVEMVLRPKDGNVGTDEADDVYGEDIPAKREMVIDHGVQAKMQGMIDAIELLDDDRQFLQMLLEDLQQGNPWDSSILSRIAERMGIPQDRAKRMRRRVFQRLRDALKGREPDDLVPHIFL